MVPIHFYVDSRGEAINLGTVVVSYQLRKMMISSLSAKQKTACCVPFNDLLLL